MAAACKTRNCITASRPPADIVGCRPATASKNRSLHGERRPITVPPPRPAPRLTLLLVLLPAILPHLVGSGPFSVLLLEWLQRQVCPHGSRVHAIGFFRTLIPTSAIQ